MSNEVSKVSIEDYDGRRLGILDTKCGNDGRGVVKDLWIVEDVDEHDGMLPLIICQTLTC